MDLSTLLDMKVIRDLNNTLQMELNITRLKLMMRLSHSEVINSHLLKQFLFNISINHNDINLGISMRHDPIIFQQSNKDSFRIKQLNKHNTLKCD